MINFKKILILNFLSFSILNCLILNCLIFLFLINLNQMAKNLLKSVLALQSMRKVFLIHWRFQAHPHLQFQDVF